MFETPISTVSIDGNRSSHFNPLRDSMRIYFVLLRFSFSSLAAAGVDLGVFAALFSLTGHLLESLIAARLVSSLLNFSLNKAFVFHSRMALAASLVKYYLLVGFIAAASYVMIRGLTGKLGAPVIAVKILVDTAPWLVTFAVQRFLVFAVADPD